MSSPSAAPAKRCWPRGIASVILLAIALTCHIVSVATPLIVMERQLTRPHPVLPNVTFQVRNKVVVGVMKSRIEIDVPGTEVGDQDYVIDTKELPSCEKVHDLTDALRAMFFTSLGLCCFCLLAAILNMLGMIPSLVTSILLMITIPFGGVGALIAFLLWEKQYCVGIDAWADRDGAHIWTATPFLISAVILEKITWILTCCLPKGPHDHVCGKKPTPETNEPVEQKN